MKSLKPICRTFLAPSLAAMIGSGGLAAQAAPPLDHWPFNGSLHILTTTPQCGSNPDVDEIYSSMYRPLIAGDSNPGALHLYKLRQAVRMVDTSAQGQFRGSGTYNGVQLTGRGTIETYTGAYSGVVVTPATITGTTLFVTMRGTITNMDNKTGCTVTFRASFDVRAK